MLILFNLRQKWGGGALEGANTVNVEYLNFTADTSTSQR